MPGSSETVRGTAMDEAKGEDINNINSNSNYFNIKKEDLDSSSSLKRDIADLQCTTTLSEILTDT